MLQVWTAMRHVYKGTLSLVSRTNGVHTSAVHGCPIPINDLHRVSPDRYTDSERDQRCKLAALYRLVHQEGWTQYIYNHITAQVGENHHFLLNPFGLLYEEVTASNLLKVNLGGEVIDPGTTLLGVNLAGYLLHSAIHAARPDVKCVVHIHSPYAAAVSTMKCGLLPMSQEALLLGEISYHPYSGILVDQTERKAITKNLGTKNKNNGGEGSSDVHGKLLPPNQVGGTSCGTTAEDTPTRPGFTTSSGPVPRYPCWEELPSRNFHHSWP
ncbi:ADD1 [Branchiostoma lanceolatum]|uniref:ADD1 protein n=1 Tax=Branchiostoma lanceolatum TaxID=7740 RepID=A0A8K0EM62_BRALA|nr:ADD1 [Branchiostoma lanceolatum]